MKNQFETGHAKNVANLSKYNQFLITLAATYNPSNVNITSSALVTLYNNADAKLTNVNNALNLWKADTNQRELAFEALNKLSTQLLGALQSTGVVKQTIDDFAFLVKKLRGGYDGKLTKADAGKLVSTATTLPVSNTISTSQKSFDNKLQHFSKMILLLQGQTTYAPNELAFQVATLQAQLTTLTNLNNSANTSYANLKAARIDRNSFFYAKDVGLLDLVKNSKAYIKSLYGAASQQYKAANALKFIRVIEKKKAN